MNMSTKHKSALDIQNVQFKKKKFGGVDEVQVREFINSIAHDYEELMIDYRFLRKMFAQSKKELDELKKLEDAVGDALASAKEKEEQIIADARKEADDILEQAYKDVVKYQDQKEALKAEVHDYHKNLASLLEQNMGFDPKNLS